MSSADNFAEAFENIRAAVETGRLAHAYLIVGSPRGEGCAFAEAVLTLLFCEAAQKPCGKCPGCRRVADHQHPDIVWIEPESRGRHIEVGEQIRPLIQQISQTSYSGGWKAGVLLYADRMSGGASNAFLKTLEEPSPRSLFLLVTDAPQAILPTIHSRCQRITIALDHALPEGEWFEPLMAVLRQPLPATPLGRLFYAAQLRDILLAEKDKILSQEKISMEEEAQYDEFEDEEDEDLVSRKTLDARVQAQYIKCRADLLKVILLWHRDVLLCALQLADAPLYFTAEAPIIRRHAATLTYAKALANVRIVETMFRRLERSVSDTAVFEAGILAAVTD